MPLTYKQDKLIMSMHGNEKLVQKPKGTIENTLKVCMADWRDRVNAMKLQAHPAVPHGPPPKGVSSMRALPEVHDALRRHDPSP